MIQDNKKCLFFASDYHFEMICLPYVIKKIKENKAVTILTENNLCNSVNKILENISCKLNKNVELCSVIDKVKIIDWKNDNDGKINDLENNKDGMVFIKGSTKFIENVSKKIKNISNIEVINCFDLSEIGNDVSNVAKNYQSVLVTSNILEA